MSGVLGSRVHDMELRYCRTGDLPFDYPRTMQSELWRQDKEDANRVDWIGGRQVDNRIGISDVYMDFDTSERDFDSSDPSQGRYVFNIRQEGVTGNGYIGATSDLHDVIFIESKSFIFPELPCYKYILNAPKDGCYPYGANSNLPILIANTCPDECIPPGPLVTNTSNASTDPCAERECECPTYLLQTVKPRITMQIEEVAEQAVSTTGGKKHTLTYDILNQTLEARTLGNIYATPIDFGYIFTVPITRLDTITMVFRNSIGRPIVFNEDVLRNVAMDSISFSYSNLIPSAPIIPAYNAQFLEFVTASEDGFDELCPASLSESYMTDLIRPNYQLMVRNLCQYVPSKLEHYLNNPCITLLAGASGYDPKRSFRLNPDVVTTEFINVYSRRYNLVNNASTSLINSRTSTTVALNYQTQIILREWKEIPQPYPLPADPLPAGDMAIHRFREREYLYIDNTKIVPRNQVISYNGNFYWVDASTDIYYDRVVLTQRASTPTPAVTFLITQGGIETGKRSMVAAIPLDRSKITKINVRPTQYVVEPNIRTDISDLVESRQFTYSGQYLTSPSDPTLINRTVIINSVGQSFRMFHQGSEPNPDPATIPISSLTPLPTNRVYHIESLSDIYADKIVLTRGLSGCGGVNVIVARNNMRIPLRFRKIERRITNYVAP